MADQLATPADLASLLQADLDAATATLLIELATSVVQQAAGGQRIVQVVGDSITILGTTDNWLDLPQIPVTAVTSVSQDGTVLTAGTDYKRFGNRLWRKFGWQTNYGWPFDLAYSKWGGYPPPSVVSGYPYQEPASIAVVCTHGYATGAQELQLARQACLSLASGVYANPDGTTQTRIDDYTAAYDAMASKMEASPHLKAALRKQYGRRAGLVRIG
ncbi:MAG: hypothetical protein JWO67_2574 [Streptosporangiaceae bacterium]|nr:hypothetical protein [Streptosporangiaceae bacterium]